MRTIAIAHRFCGPTTSGNGGYSCGVVARELGGTSATVRLHAPPPLDVALRVVRRDGEVWLMDDEKVIARGRPADDAFSTTPGPPASDAVRSAATSFDVDTYSAEHPFSRCFTCGPAREPDDGLRIFPAPLDDGSMVVWPWVPTASMGDDDGLVSIPMIWAALDCPSGQAFMSAPTDPAGPSVLGEMSVRVISPPNVGAEVLVGGWRRERAGRKLLAGSAMWNERGELLAEAAATWIELDGTQSVAFGADS